MTGNIFIEDGIDRVKYLPMLTKWYVKEHNAVVKEKYPKRYTALFACPVWGAYVDRFLNICIPSLLAPGNLPALTTGIILLLHTDKASKPKLEKGLAHLRKYKVKVIIKVIPARIIAETGVRKLNKYWLLGSVQNYYLRFAKVHGLGFHMLMPDHVYSHEYFYNLGRLSDKHPFIVQGSINGHLKYCSEDLEPYRKGKRLIVPAKELAAIGCNYLHSITHAGIMNGRDWKQRISRSHIFLWRGKRELRIYCPHSTIAWISAELVKHVPLRLFSALDTQLPYLAPEPIPVYVPTLKDNMVYVELSDDSKPDNKELTHFDEFAARYWMANKIDGYLRYFRRGHSFPLPYAKDGMNKKDIDKGMKALLADLVACKGKKYTFQRI